MGLNLIPEHVGLQFDTFLKKWPLHHFKLHVIWLGDLERILMFESGFLPSEPGDNTLGCVLNEYFGFISVYIVINSMYTVLHFIKYNYQ